jgi:nickel-type superoxide dismutase maturation protease
MLLKVMKVTGESLSPFFESGDYVVLAGWGLGRVGAGAVVVFRHPVYGTLIKRVEHITPEGELFVVGTHPESTDSRAFGAIPRKWLIGKVIFEVRKH